MNKVRISMIVVLLFLYLGTYFLYLNSNSCREKKNKYFKNCTSEYVKSNNQSNSNIDGPGYDICYRLTYAYESCDPIVPYDPNSTPKIPWTVWVFGPFKLINDFLSCEDYSGTGSYCN